MHPSQAFTLSPQNSASESGLFDLSTSTSSLTPTIEAAAELDQTVRIARKNDYTRLTQSLDNLNVSSDGIASTIDEYIGWTGFALSDDNVSSSVIDSINAQLGLESDQSSTSGFVSLKDGIRRTQAAAERANAAAEQTGNGIRDAGVGPSYAELKEMKSDEPPPFLLVLGTSLASVFLLSRVIR